jgi:DTW domain-containing protein YfiP
METEARIILLMHPKEWRRDKCTTGRLACLHLAQSRIIPGLDFSQDERVAVELADPAGYPVLLYPGEGATVLGESPTADSERFCSGLGGRRLLVFIFDATWACAQSMARHNPQLLALPRLMFLPREPSRFRIKRQPAPHCLSTIEAIHALLSSLADAGIERYPDRQRLLAAFEAMQEYQIERFTATGKKPRYLPRSEAGGFRGGSSGTAGSPETDTSDSRPKSRDSQGDTRQGKAQ